MDDLRGRLDRASRRVEPRPDAMDVLRARRRRHDLRQRVTAGAVALTVTAMLIGGGVALINGRETGTQPATPPSEPMFLSLWPERTQADAEQVQAALDAGDESLSWRTDPQEVAKRFVTDVMGWQEDMGDVPGIVVEPRRDSPGTSFRVTRTVHSWPFPGPPLWENSGETIYLEQLGDMGPDGIWSVTEVRGDGLSVDYQPGEVIPTDAGLQGRMEPSHRAGDGVELGGDGGSACSAGQVIQATGPTFDQVEDFEPWTAEVGFYRNPDCGEIGDGYIALMAGPDGIVDPFRTALPGAQYIPTLTMLPVRFVESPVSAEPSPQAEGAPYFPTMTHGYATGNSAASVGTLHEQDGCVVVGDGPRADVPVWPEGFSIRNNDDGTFTVLDANDRPFASSGKRVFLGGYHAQASSETMAWIEEHTGDPVPDGCVGGGFWMMASGGGGEVEGSVFHVTCDGTGTAVDESFATSGSHGWIFEVNNTTDGSVKLAVEEGPNYLGPVGPGVTKLGYIDAPPGDLRIACSDSAGGYSEWVGLHTASVFGLYTSPDLQCAPGDQWMNTISDYVSTTQGETGDLLVLARKDLSGLKATDEVRFSGYEEEPDQPIVVLRDDKRIASITYAPAPQGPGWIPSEVQTCESSGIR